MSNSKRLHELDVIRGIAALSIVLFHYTTRYHKIYGHSETLFIKFPYGIYGIELFFILSGFVIFFTMERTKSVSDYVVGRFSRLYPAYWTAVLVTFMVVALVGLPGRQVGLSDALINLTMLQSFFEVPHVDGSYWTLARELSFYTIMFTLYKFKLLKHINIITSGWLFLMAVNILLKNQTDIVMPIVINIFLLLDYVNLFIVGIMLYQLYKEGYSTQRYAIIAACLLTYKLEHSWKETLLLISFILILALILRGWLTLINQPPCSF